MQKTSGRETKVSIYSTRTVSRSTAIAMILVKIGFQDDNESLGNMLDKLYSEETLNNYLVRDDEDVDTDQ